MVLAMPRPHRRPESSKFYVRKVIPAELRPLFGGKWELRASLGASDPAEAKRLHTDALARFEAQIAAARARHRGQVRNLTPREVDELCGRWYAAEAAKYADDPGTVAEWDAVVDHYAHSFVTHPGEGSEFIGGRALADEAGAWLTARGIAADTPSLSRFARRWAETHIRFARAMMRRAEGDWSEDPNPAAFPSPAAPSAPASRGVAPAATREPAACPSLTFAAPVTA